MKGVGAVLSQKADNGLSLQVAYASRALSLTQKCDAITELETVVVVWAITHIQAYRYGHDGIVYTNHAAVRTVLETPSPSGKHARWWSRVFGSGIKSLNIIYRTGKENCNASALSRNPCQSALEQSSIERVCMANVQPHSPTHVLTDDSGWNPNLTPEQKHGGMVWN